MRITRSSERMGQNRVGVIGLGSFNSWWSFLRLC